MKIKLVSIFVCMLLFLTIIPFSVTAGDQDNPEVKDWMFDTIGLFGMFPKFLFKNIDIKAAWFYEKQTEPDYMYVSIELRNLKNSLPYFETIYTVLWSYNNIRYQVGLNDNPYQEIYFRVGINDGTQYSCEGIIDEQNNIITWKIPKNKVGNPQQGEIIIEPTVVSTLRFPFESGLPIIDLLKDITNFRTAKDYTIQF